MASSKDKTYGKKLRDALGRELGVASQQRINDGLSGDKTAAYALVMHAGKYAGCLPSIAYYLDVPEPGYTAIVENAWIHCSESVIHFLGPAYRRYLRKFMLKAKFSLTGLPKGDFEIYRGVTGTDLRKAARGLSWSTSYEAACWFAFRFNKPNPLVIKATVTLDDVLFHCLKQGEHEVILKRAPRATKVDNIGEWKGNAAIRQAAIDANAKARRA